MGYWEIGDVKVFANPCGCLMLKLSEMEWMFIQVLIEKGTAGASREELLDRVWKRKNVEDNTMHNTKHRLSKKLGSKDYIQPTDDGGYRLAEAAVWHPDLSKTAFRHDDLGVPESQPRGQAQLTRWGPTDGRSPGILITNSGANEFIPWTELKPDVERRLLCQLGLHLPANCSVELDEFHGRENWLVRILDREGKPLGYVWFGTDADKEWAYDGLVRVGNENCVVWQTFQRYSDGSYWRIRVNAQPTEQKKD